MPTGGHWYLQGEEGFCHDNGTSHEMINRDSLKIMTLPSHSISISGVMGGLVVMTKFHVLVQIPMPTLVRIPPRGVE